MNASPSNANETPTAAEVWAALRALVAERDDQRRAVSDALGMSFVRSKALRRLVGNPLTQRELAAVLTIDAPYTTVIVDDLERRGLVTRCPHPSDRRAKLVTLTPAGEAAAATAERILGTPPPEVAALEPAELATLDRILRQINNL